MTTSESATRALSNIAYDQVRDPLAFVRELGDAIAKSQMFGCENVEQGRVLAMTCLAKRVDPLSLVERYHLIQGDLSMRSDAMLAGLRGHGGRHRIIQRDANAAEIEISIDGETQCFRLTWEEAEQEDFTKDKKGNVKKNYSTPRSRMQMLWARVVSDGVRAMCPEVVCGAYTPEEIIDHRPEGNGHAAVAGAQKPSPPTKQTDEAIDASFEIVPESDKSAADQISYATADQVKEITDLYVRLNVPYEAQQAALQKRGVQSLRSLELQQAAELLAKLRQKAAETPLVTAETSKGDPAATSVQVNKDPCTQPQIDEVQNLLRLVTQMEIPDICDKVKARLQKAGLEKIRDLTVSECDALIRGLEAKNLDAWVEMAIQGHKPF